jgi:hypothetical protein
VTRDLDLLGFGDSSIKELQKVFREICEHEVTNDGVVFDPASVKAEPIEARALPKTIHRACRAGPPAQ